MLAGLTLLLLFQCAGELLVHELGLPFPGPVLGMLLLFVTLMVRRQPIFEGLRQAGQGILQHLSLLFIPAGVGVMLYYKTLISAPISMIVILIISTVAAIAVTGLVLRWLAPHVEEPPQKPQ